MKSAKTLRTVGEVVLTLCVIAAIISIVLPLSVLGMPDPAMVTHALTFLILGITIRAFANAIADIVDNTSKKE